MIVADQASADTKYDIVPPPRVVEAFSTTNETTQHIVCILLIVGSLLLVVRVQSMPLRILGIGILVLSIHYLLSKLENRTV